MEKFLEITFLYDFYGQLLTDKQQSLIQRYYLDDLSLGEIALQENVSRQSVYDTIKKAEHKLIGYEQKLGLFARFKEQQNQLQSIIKMLTDIQANVHNSEETVKISYAIEHIQTLLND